MPIPERCSLPCNKGTCKITALVGDTGKRSEHCECPEQFTGRFCEIYRCSDYCKNKGTCYIDTMAAKSPIDGRHPLKCYCPAPWTGERCEISLEMCRKLCHNGAVCSFEGDKTKCVCAEGYHGQHCEHCQDMTCQNGGVCRKTDRNNSGCDCPDGFTGRMCENDICQGYCSPNGKCRVGVRGPSCVCEEGYTGARCHERVTRKCYNGGTSTTNGLDSKCMCPARFSGESCEMDLCESEELPLECVSLPANRTSDCSDLQCRNGGMCKIGDDGKPSCYCQNGYGGDLCEVCITAHNYKM